MELEVWLLQDLGLDDRVVLYWREFHLVIEPRFAGWKNGVETYDLTTVDTWTTMRPDHFLDGYNDDESLYTFVGYYGTN